MALLKTLLPETLATLHDNLRSTIIPAVATTTAGTRAMEILTQLSSASETSQLQTGEVIGEGGMGVIRAATQIALGRGVAVKTLKEGRTDPASALDLLREAWVTGSIEHPNVVPVHYLQIDRAGIPVIVMKRISGVEWSTLLGDATEVEKRFGATDLLAWNLGILDSVLNALRYAHSRGIVHRDVKPSNVMIGDFGEVYLLDWGIAVSLRDDGSGRLPLAANARQLAGTPHYMAPEMLGQPDSAAISERTDIYLAGSVLYELIAGRPPHEGSTVGAVIASVLGPPPQMPAHAPPELARICRRAMHPLAAERFESVEAMQHAIAAYLEHRGSADLAARAAVRVDELLPMLATSDAGDDHRDAVYRLYDACRFGFHEALSVWRDNADAQAGLERATTAVAEYELATGNPKGAVTLLGELANPPAELLARARSDAAAQAKHHAELEHLRSDHDPTTGRRTRTFFSVTVGVAFTVIPLVNELSPALRAAGTHGRNVALSVGALVVLAALAVWARNSMMSTSFNRRISATGVLVFVGHVILSSGAAILDLPFVQTEVMFLFYWGTITSLLMINLDRWLWPAAISYFIWFFVAATHVELRYYAMAAGNLGFAINAYVRWRPATLRQTPEERAERDARDERARRHRRRG